jgi:hypothetical protein
MANRGAVGADLGLISSSRTLGHTAILLLGITGLAMARKSKILAAIALGTATHLLLDNLGDRLMDPQHSSSALSALIFPLNGFEFAISPFKSFSDHMISIPNRFTITGEILGALILLWDQWKLNHRSEILIRLRKRLRRRR